jgi:gamma-glutamyltranspeptidase
VTPNRTRRFSWGVASPHPASTDAAAALLAAGGTAVDAAIAAAGVLTVVYPHNCSIGGDLIALVREADRQPRAVFGVGRTARAIDADALRRTFGERVPAYGPFSISVPGVVSGWQVMHELGGRRPLRQLFEPAVALASGGTAVSVSLARALEDLETSDPGVAEIFGPPGKRLGLGDVLVQPVLAETLAQVGADPDSYYRGKLAHRLAAGLEAAGSPITIEDFARHRPIVADSTMTAAGTLAPRLFTAGLPSQGLFFAAIATIVGGLLEKGYDLAGVDAGLLGRAFGEISVIRDDLLCDPARSPGEARINARLAAIDLFRSPSVAGTVDRHVTRRAARPSGDTVAVVTVDQAGNSVSMLQSVFHSFGSRVLDPATGVLFHNRQSMFTLRPGMPGELGPGLMPPHTLCPTMVDASEGNASLVLATMGGRGQPQILAQTLMQLAAGMSASEAVAAPRFIVGDTEDRGAHHVATAEADLPEVVVTSLAESGFDVRVVREQNEEMGHAQLLCVGEEGVVGAGADPRSDGVARRAPRD